jgi:hypothetical protein
MVCVYFCATHEYAQSFRKNTIKIKKKKEGSLADVFDVGFLRVHGVGAVDG